MNPSARRLVAPVPAFAGCRRWAVLGLLAVCALAFSGCTAFRRELPRPGRTVLGSPLTIIPAMTLSNYLVVEAKWDKHGPYHFLIDTGASVSLIAPALAARYQSKEAPPPETPLVRVKSAEGDTALLTATTLERIELAGARFENVQALIYDCAAISAHLGVQIDGILGFPLFRETTLTLDYPHSRILIQPRTPTPLLPGSTVVFNNERRTPIIPLRLGDQTFVALIDSGNDAALSFNPAGLQAVFAVPPRVGAAAETISGGREQTVGRLADTLVIGDYAVERPVTDVTNELSSIGGGLLRNFIVTFDQENSRVTFFRDSRTPIPAKPLRHAGVSFDKTPAYWRIARVVAGSPAEQAGIQLGDLVIRIDGDSVSKWDINRYKQLVETADDVTFTFLVGTHETDRRVKIFDLVP